MLKEICRTHAVLEAVTKVHILLMLPYNTSDVTG